MSKARDLANVATRSADLKAGTTAFFAMNTAPTGWIKANGAAVSRTTYADLFAAIGTTYGVGNGSTTFALPDLRGEFPRGFDDGRGVDSGRALGSTQDGKIKDHRHVAAYAGGYVNAGDTVNARIITSIQTTTNEATIGSTGLVLNSEATTETRPRNVALLACIKF